MNREIKFRAWHKVKNIMVYDNEDDTYGYWDGCRNSNVGMINTILNSQYYKEYKFMQYTGLKDKNKKKIYEGDIVKITEKEKISKHKVIPMKPIIADIEWSEEYLTYTLITTSVKDAFESLTDYLDECDIEVIGNIYDNPELLGGE
jgi:uncharacterized phage protein (TIGR01671 family)